MSQAKEILIVDDEIGIRELLSEILQDEGYRVSVAENATAARAYRARQTPALVLLDIWMPDTDGVTLLREWAAGGQLTMPVIMMSGHGTIETAVEATKIGAFDFLEKPVGLQKLLAAVSRALKAASAKEPQRVSLSTLGTGPAVRDVERQLEQLLATRKPILILGEPGTGHAAAAHALHLPETPWVALTSNQRLVSNPLSLLEEAREGTLYCAEIGQYSKVEQKGLAFLLQKLERAGVSLVCTSAEPLGNMAAEGAVMLPPLRARREDIPALIDRYWDTASGSAIGPQGLDSAALEALCGAHWPGNLDHLQSVIANLALNPGEIAPDFVKRLLGESAAPARTVAPELTARFFELPLREAREAFERVYFEQLLGREQSNMSKVAELAGLERTHLYRKLKQLGIRFSRRGDDASV